MENQHSDTTVVSQNDYITLRYIGPWDHRPALPAGTFVRRMSERWNTVMRDFDVKIAAYVPESYLGAYVPTYAPEYTVGHCDLRPCTAEDYAAWKASHPEIYKQDGAK